MVEEAAVERRRDHAQELPLALHETSNSPEGSSACRSMSRALPGVSSLTLDEPRREAGKIAFVP